MKFAVQNLLFIVVAVSCLLLGSAQLLLAQHAGEDRHGEPHEAAAALSDRHGHAASPDGWEGSAAGIAYSERNHHIAGLLVALMGLAELSHALRLSSLGWARFLLPTALICTGLFLTIWSDHEAWPIGSLSFVETFFGHDHEILQHKTYGFLALLVGSVELFRRLGRMGHVAWTTPLPLMAVIGGLMLFGHSHGDHPAAHKIALHHAVMGTMAISAGASKFWSDLWVSGPMKGLSKWDFLWAGLILLIGAQLLIYSE